MNGPPVPQASFLLIFLLLVLLLLVPGTLLGWIAAARIRRSGGGLYGLRLAAFAAMLFPGLMLVLMPFLSFLLILRISRFPTSFSEEDAVFLGGAVFVSLALLSAKVILGSLRRVLGKGRLREGFGLRKNRLLVGALALLWVAVGVIFFLQRPRGVDTRLVRASPDGNFVAEGSTWHRMHVFDSDETFYRFEIRDHEGRSLGRWYRVPITRAPASLEVEVASPEELAYREPGAETRFGSHGAIEWSDDSRQVRFLVGGTEVFNVPVPHW